MTVVVKYVRALQLVAVAAVGVLVLAGCASTATAGRSTGPSAGPTTTQVAATVTARHTFDPWSRSGALTVPVHARATGSCWTSSIAAPGGATYRCLAGNQILDPCFAHGTSTTLACVAAPWADATVLRVTGLPRATPVAARVWAFQLADGLRCVAATGTVPDVGGVDLDYVCGHGFAAAIERPAARTVTAELAAPGARTLRNGTVVSLWHS